MCTAITYRTNDFYFGRNLDFDLSYGEKVVITPRNFPVSFKKKPTLTSHYAIIGIAAISQNYPLYYDAMNEKGLCMAGLLFPGNAIYKSAIQDADNITPYELIPWILGQCASVKEAKILLDKINIVDLNFSDELPLTPLHWLLSDKQQSLTIEPLSAGLKIYENPTGVLTNNPPFETQLFNLNNYMHLSNEEPTNRFSINLDLSPYSRGMGAIGLPGDLSSASRFVRAVFTKMNSVSGNSESESLSQFFHILQSVTQQRGCVKLGNNNYEITIYSSCYSADKGIYYYTTYENNQINAVCLNNENKDGNTLISYPLVISQNINFQN